MKDIFKFIGIIIATYAVIMLLLNVSFLEKPFNSIFRQSLESIVKLSFPDAYIETQDFLNAKQKSDPNVFYLVYGNPEVIKAEADYAAKQNLSEYKISSYSSQSVSYTHLRAHETVLDLVCRLLLEKKKK